MAGNIIQNLLRKNKPISREAAAKILKTRPEALEAFEEAYVFQAFPGIPSDDLFECDSAEIRRQLKKVSRIPEADQERGAEAIIDRIVQEFLSGTQVLTYDGERLSLHTFPTDAIGPAVTKEEIMQLPEALRPQLSGSLMKKDLSGPPAYRTLLEYWEMSRTDKNPKMRKTAYHMFRQGLDILDLDPVMYRMLDMNPNAIGYWFPALAQAIPRDSFFQIPKTKVMKVPMPMLQLTRLDYGSLTPATLKVVDRFCHTAFELDDNKEYFVKTGTYSSKFDFRNAHVHEEKEVRELGEYLLYIQNQACQAAGPLSSPCIYGMSTTNEWCVREYIPDRGNNPCIYKGLPLRTEYRVFVDFDTDEVLGISPYWDPDTMRQRLGHEEDAGNPHKIHDYTIFLMHEETLMRRYRDGKGKVLDAVKELIPEIDLPGQWSMDIMQDGEDFWIIDMALAVNSALKECIPAGKLKSVEENWIPDIGGGEFIGEKKRNTGD